jgi:hypothetical protein
MKIMKKLCYGLLSLVMLFFYTVSNGFPKSRILNSIRGKVEKQLKKSNRIAPETLILEQPDTSYTDDFASHTSHRSHSSHSSHSSHASHRSGTTSTGSTTTKKTTPDTTTEYRNPFAKYLTIADVERITGLTGVQQNLEPFILHFLLSDGKQILQVKFSEKGYFNNFKNDKRYSPIQGIGDGALIGTLQLPIQLLLVKGQFCVEIMTFPKEGLKLFLSFDQLKTVANYISSRLTGL